MGSRGKKVTERIFLAGCMHRVQSTLQCCHHHHTAASAGANESYRDCDTGGMRGFGLVVLVFSDEKQRGRIDYKVSRCVPQGMSLRKYIRPAIENNDNCPFPGGDQGEFWNAQARKTPF